MLTVRDHTALRLAAARFKYEGARASAIHEQLSMTPTRFAQYVGALLDRPDALAAYPSEVRRLRRLREQRQAQRSSRRWAS